MNYKVKITEFLNRENSISKVSIEYPPSPTSYTYKMYEDGVQEMLIEKLLILANDKNAEIEVKKVEILAEIEL